MSRLSLGSYYLIAGLTLSACVTGAPRAAGVVVSPADAASTTQWSDDERNAEVVMRNLRQSDEASFHLLRVRTALPPRKHEKSDMVLMVVAGQLELSLGDRRLPGAPGDVIEVPRGVPYGVKSKGDKPGVLYVVYTPAFNVDDVRKVAESTGGDAAWKWNLWTQ